MSREENAKQKKKTRIRRRKLRFICNMPEEISQLRESERARARARENGPNDDNGKMRENSAMQVVKSGGDTLPV